MATRESVEQSFRTRVAAAKQLLEDDLYKEMEKWDRLPIQFHRLKMSADSLYPHIENGFRQFLDVGKQFKIPSPVKWAKRATAKAFQKSFKGCTASDVPFFDVSRFLDRLAAEQILQEAPDEVVEESVFSHSVDYRSICFRGETYHLTCNQAAIIKVLHEAFQRGTPSVGKSALLAAVESETSRIQDSFKGSPLWQTLVVSAERRGTYRLNLITHS